MLQTMLTDTQWNKLHHTGFIYHKTKHRQALEGILYRMRTSIPWHDLPSEFGKWNSVFQRLNAWSKLRQHVGTGIYYCLVANVG